MSAADRRAGVGWVAGLAVAVIVTSAGFALGIVAGVSWEEPGLFIGWLTGETDGIAWGVDDAEPIASDPGAVPDVAAAPPQPAPQTPPPLGSRSAQPPSERAVSASPVSRPAARASAEAAPERVDVAAAPPAAAAAVQGRFSVQVGAFADRKTADSLAASLRSAGFPVYLSDGASGARWRVRVGPHPTRDAAERSAERLKKDRKLPTWILSDDA